MFNKHSEKKDEGKKRTFNFFCRNVEVQECFSLFDKDGDGSIAAKEVGAVLRSLGYNPSEDEIAQLVDEIDSEGNVIIYK